MTCEVPEDGGATPVDGRSWSPDEARVRWSRYRQQRDEAQKALLAEAYRYLVAEVVRATLGEKASDPALGGVQTTALQGLEDAIDRFPDNGDPSRFEEFATARVRLAVEDALQRVDWMPRTLHRRRVPQPPRPLATALPSGELSVDDVLAADHGRARPGRPGRIDPPAPALDPARAPYLALAQIVGLPSASSVEPGMPRPDLTVRHALRRLPEQHRTVLTLQFLAGLTFEQVGALLGATAIAARRASDQALASLRRAIEDESGGSLAAAAAG